MKRILTDDDVLPMVMGGAILGGGGGGLTEPGLRIARLAVQVGQPQLWSADEFDDDDLATTVALIGAPAAPRPHMTPAQLLRALELLRGELGGRPLVAIHPNENGSETSVNGWFQSAMTGLPILDFACNGRAHPSSVMGAMGLHLDPDYVSIQAYAGGDREHYTEGVTRGFLSGTSGIVRRASVEAGGMLACARNPTTVGYATANGAPGALSAALELGHRFIRDGLAGAIDHLGADVIAEGEVVDYTCVQEDGVDVGHLTLAGTKPATLHFVNEYMVAEHEGERLGTFPELIATFTDDGQPIPSAHVRVGQKLTVILAHRDHLRLAGTMWMPELYAPLEAAIGIRFAPEPVDAVDRG